MCLENLILLILGHMWWVSYSFRMVFHVNLRLQFLHIYKFMQVSLCLDDVLSDQGLDHGAGLLQI